MSEVTAPISDHIIGIRAHDMHHGFANRAGGILTKVKNTRIIGACAQLCTIIKDSEVITNYNQLEMAAAEVGIDEFLLQACLGKLQEVEFVRIRQNPFGTVSRLDSTVPVLTDSYEKLGKLWRSSSPSELELLNIQVLDDLSVRPEKRQQIQDRYHLTAVDITVLQDIGIAGSYIEHYVSPTDTEEIWFSPLHWDESPDKIFALAKKFPDSEISRAFKLVRTYQGAPSEKVGHLLLKQAIASGCLPTAAVSSTNGERQFIFTPETGVGKAEKSILNKARAIIACVRYGEHFASITKVRNPVALISALRDRKRLAAHSESLRQYEILRNLGVGRLEPDKFNSERHTFILTDNAENMKAIDMALQMLQIGVATPERGDIESARCQLIGGYRHPSIVRADLIQKERAMCSGSTLVKINDIIRGVSVDLI